MKHCEAFVIDQLFVDFRIVFHRAGTKRIHALVHPVVFAGQIGIMADDVDFAYFRQKRFVTAFKFLRKLVTWDFHVRKVVADSAGNR